MMRRALLGGAALLLVAPSVLRAGSCAAPRVDLADWPIVRSSSMPGFSLRLPRAFTRDVAAKDSTASARWSDAMRGRFVMSHLGATASVSALPTADGRPTYARCEERVGSASAIIVSVGEGTSGTPYVVHARIRWPDGEELDVRADATDREHFEQLLAAVRTIRRVGA